MLFHNFAVFSLQSTMAIIKIQVSDPGPSLPSCLLMEVIYLLALLVTTIYIDQNLKKKKNLQFSENPLLVGRKVVLLNVLIISNSNHSYWVSLLHPFIEVNNLMYAMHQ